MKWLRWVLIPLAVSLLVLSFWVKTPFLFSFEPWVSIALVVGACALVLLSAGELVWDEKELSWVRILLFGISLMAAGVVVGRHIRFGEIKREVLQQANEQIDKRTNEQIIEPRFGEHFILGYTDPEEMKMLIKAGVGGVFVSARNARGKTVDALREEIQSFLDIRPDLFIATDWEGGVVQKLSPPLSKMTSLGEATNAAMFAATQAKELRSVGVNVNFAPVVDLDPKQTYKHDKYTKISKRAISDDPEKVASVAGEYINGLLDGGIIPTIKHFPGLRLAKGDTHLIPVTMDVTRQELEKDWMPFEKLLDDSVWLMMSHVKVSGLEPMKVVREEWGFDGVVVSDDWSMFGAGSAKDALNSGVDIILVAFDPEIYYQVMKEMLVADQQGKLDRGKLFLSEEKIGRARGIFKVHEK